MKIAVWYGGKNVKIDEASIPEIDDNDVLVKVRASGICGSDLHAYQGVSQRRIPPLLMGHEFAGEVEKIGKSVKIVKTGDRVVINPLVSCSGCEQCIRGSYNLCRNRRLIGLHLPGGFAEFVSVPSDRCLLMPNNMSYEEGVMVEPLSVAVHAVNRSQIRSNDTIMIVGTGIIGLLALQVVRLKGAGKIFASDLSDYRLSLAKKLGAYEVVNAREVDPVQKILKLTDNLGVDLVFEAVGTQQTVDQALKMVCGGGNIIIIGMLKKSMELDVLDIPVRELSIIGTYGYLDQDFRAAITLISSKKVDVEPIVTTILPLDDIQKGFEAMAKQEAIKAILRP